MEKINKISKELFEKFDIVYRKLKTIDEAARKLNRYSANVDIQGAMLGYIASFGLSMIKDLYLNNKYSVGFALSIRCIIEGFSVFMYANERELSTLHKGLFKLQALYTEKQIYEQYKIFDKQLFNLTNINDNFKKFQKDVSTKYKKTSKQLKEILQSAVPFLGDVKSFESLISENMANEILMLYKSISLFVHPYDYRVVNAKLFENFAMTIFLILEDITTNTPASEVGLEDEYFLTIDSNKYMSTVRKLAHKQMNKIKILCGMLDDTGFNFLAFSLGACCRIMADYLLDVAMGYAEQSTTKWKTVVENLWMLDLAISDEYVGKDNDLISYHSRIKLTINAGENVTEENLKEAYELYKKKYPQGCDFEVFKKSFLGTTGYTINELGETTSLRKVAFSLIDEYAPKITEGKLIAKIITDSSDAHSEEEKDQNAEIDINSFLKMKYDESQALSHATGYLYYCLDGAWADGYLLAYLFEELMQLLLTKLFNNLKVLNNNKTIDKKMVNFLRNFLDENKKYILEKKDLYLVPKVDKNF